MRTPSTSCRCAAICSALLALVIANAGAQTVTRVKDARAGTDGSVPWLFRFAGGAMYFFASQSSTEGQQLWQSDGTAAGTSLVKKLCSAEVMPQSLNPTEMMEAGGLVYFVGSVCESPGEYGLWRSDGTDAGTVLLHTFPGTPANLTNVNGTLLFVGYDAVSGRELWRSDGTPSGTGMVKDISLGAGSSIYGLPQAVGNNVFFAAYDSANGSELWKSDGTEAGTVLVRDIAPGAGSSNPSTFANVQGTLYFVADDHVNGRELWKSDGTEAGTVLVKDIAPGITSPSLLEPCALGDALYFTADDGTTGRELWRSDGTPAGTYLVADIVPGLASASPSSLVAVGQTLFFTAADASGRELWKSDGTAAGTVRLKDIASGAASSSPGFLAAAPSGNLLYFMARSSETSGAELWKSDGTTTGTVMIRQILPATSSEPVYLTAWPGIGIAFQASDGTHGIELWKSDGTAGGTVMVKDIDQTAGSLFTDGDGWNGVPGVVSQGRLFFVGSDDVHGREVWVSDGTSAGTKMLKDMNPEGGPSEPRYLTEAGGKVFFYPYTRAFGWELWVSDGTSEGTQLVKDILPGPAFNTPTPLTAMGGRVFFAGDDRVSGAELWVSDGTPEGTVEVKDIFPGRFGSSPSGLREAGGTVYFAANDGVAGPELWKSDGTADGTVLVADVQPGDGGSYPKPLGAASGMLVFAANTRELWSTDGTAGGTEQIGSLDPEAASVTFGDAVSLGSVLVFMATTSSETELWRSDGSSSGTYMLAAFERASTAWSSQANMRRVGDRVFFQARTAAEGSELWVTDGNTAGLVADIRPGPDSSYAGYTAVEGNGYLWFGAWDNAAGVELWRTDGTEEGTVRAADIQPGTNVGAVPRGDHSFPWLFGPVTQNKLFLSAAEAASGRELYVADLSAVLSVAKAGSGTGVVSSTPAGIACGTGCAETYPLGTWVTLAATPDSGSILAAWGGACSGAGACVVRIDQATSVTATFEPGKSISLDVVGPGGGTVTSSPAGMDCSSRCQVGFAAGTTVTLTAIPRVGSTFAGWGGACTGTGACVVTIGPSDVTVLADFDRAFTSSERAALVALYNSTNGPAWTNNGGWLGPEGTECAWYGVTCSGGWVDLFLLGNNLVGTIPSELGSLTSLRTLYLTDNQLSGTIPPELGSLVNVRLLRLGRNQLSGGIPVSLGGLSALEELDLSGNGLSGSIPAVLGDVSRLTQLDLRANQLTGDMPPTLGALPRLQNLLLGGNQLSGSIPASVASLGQLRFLDLSANQFNGTIPGALGSLAELRDLYLNGNQLSGSIPPALGGLNQLQTLALSQNQLSGGIPPTLGGLTQLRALFLFSNQLSGPVPTWLGSLALLSALDLGDNRLSGSIPSSLANLTQLTHLGLSMNQLSGAIPSALGSLSQLRWLDLANDQLNGTVPPSLGDLAQLEGLMLGDNLLGGSIPGALGNLARLRYLHLQGNALGGAVPASLGNLASLQSLRIDGNQLSGSVPPALVNLPSLLPGSSDLRWNALESSDAALIAFLNDKQAGGNWQSTQTVPPAQVSAGVAARTSVRLTWTPILYTGDTGGYRISVAPRPSGPFKQCGMTADKSAAEWIVPGLQANTTYYFVIDTVTEPHAANANHVTSQRTAPIAVTTSPGLELSAASYSVNEAGPVATITVTRKGGLASAFAVDYATSDGSATAGQDYTARNGTLVFLPNVLSRTFTVPVTNDTIVDPNETVRLTLSNPQGGAVLGPRSEAVLTIVDDDLAGQLQFGAAGYSGTEGGSGVAFTVVRAGGAASGVTVQLATRDGTAEAGSDYTAIAGALTFGAGEMSKRLTLPLMDDAVGEEDETLELVLSEPGSGAALGPRPRAVVTIHDNEAAVEFAAPAFSVTEGGPAATIQVKRIGRVTGPLTVSYETGDGTASSPDDYLARSGTLSFLPGVALQAFRVPIVNDSLAEGQEALTLSLSGATGGVLGPQRTAVLNITDNDLGGTVQFGAATYSARETAGTAVVTVTRTGGQAGGVSVDYATSDGSAQAGSDYTTTVGTLTFGAGQTALSFAVPITNDLLGEGPETANLTLSNPRGGARLGVRPTAVLTIADDEAFVALGAAAYSVTEGSMALVTVRRVGSTAGGVTVSYSTSDDSAVAPADYASQSGTLTFGAGVLSLTLAVPTVNDTACEGDEIFAVRLTGSSGVDLGAPNSAAVTIKDDDLGGVIQLVGTRFSASEGSPWAAVGVVRSGGAAGGATVQYATSDGTATAGEDYSAASGTLTFNAGETSRTLTIPLTQDWAVEGAESFNLRLTSPGGGASLGARAAAVVEIADDEAYLVFRSPGYSVTEGGGVSLLVQRVGSTEAGVTVDYATSDGTAQAGRDYVAKSGTLTFAAGVAVLPISIATTDDRVNEAIESFQVTLSGGSLPILGAPATVSIRDNDTGGVLELGAAAYGASEGAGSVTITVKRSGDTLGSATAGYVTSDQSALAGADYTLTSGTLTFTAGQVLKTFSVPILNDTAWEPSESFQVTLTNPRPGPGTSLGAVSSATVTIADDDAGGTIQFASASYVVDEGAGQARITVTRSGGAASGATVAYLALEGTATPNTDYEPSRGTLTFAAGETEATFTVPIVDDALPERGEIVALRLGATGGGATLGTRRSAQLWIVDND